MNLFNWQKLKKKMHIPTPNRPRFAILVLGLGALLGLSWLSINTQTVLVGERVRELEAKLDRVNHENAKLEYDIALLTQPRRMADRATAIGLRPAALGQTAYLNVKYTPRDALAYKLPSAAERSFDWTVWWNNLQSWLGLGVDVRAAEASR